MSTVLADAAKRLLLIREAHDSFLGFVRAAFPSFTLAPFQHQLIETLDALEKQSLGKNNLLITMPPRHGKALKDKEKIPTPLGLKNHGDLRVGDYVYHPSGLPIKVVAVSEPINVDCRVTFYDGSFIDCHEKHEWAVYDRSMARNRIVETGYLESQKLTSGHKRRARFQIAQGAELRNSYASLPIDPYTLGVWLGDGTSSSALICGAKSDLEHICKRIPYKRGTHRVHSTTGVHYQSFVDGLWSGIKSLGLINNKHIPEAYMLSNVSQRRALLAGLVDTDGSVETLTQRVRFRSSSQRLAEDVATLVRTLGYRASVDYTAPDTRHRKIRGGESWCVQWTPHDAQGGGTLPRKRVTRTRKPRAIGIKSVTRIPPTTGRCIQVDSPDGLYLAGGTLIPTHNSTIASVAFPAYYMLRNPTRAILAVSYGSDLAANFGRQVRDLTIEPICNQAFPDFELSPTSTAIDDWRTTDGGTYFACGIGGGTTGRAANLLLIDDPFKSRPQAESPSERNKVGAFYNGSLVNRKQPEVDGTPPIEILIQTRWHPDDLAGRIMDSQDWADGDWHHVDFPALRTKKRTVKGVTTEVEVALWPERFPVLILDKMRRRDPRDFAALYQQQPYIAGGNLIQSRWFNSYSRDQLTQRFHTTIIAADTAFKTKQQNDPTALVTLSLTPQGDIYIREIQRVRLDYPSLKRKLIVENARWRGQGLRGIYIEDRASGQSILQDLRREPGISVIPYKFPGPRDASDKVARVNSIIGLIEGGRIFLPEEAPWLDDFLEEIQSFPNGKHDDQVDALAMGIDVLSRIGLSNNFTQDFPDITQSLNHMAPLTQSRNLLPDMDIRQASSNWANFKPLGEL